jgi:drug/metabolite transporter (DMT)-like permease
VAVAIVLAAGAALMSAMAVVLQRVALESASGGSDFGPALMTRALRKRGWLAGLALMLCGFGLQASALRAGQLSIVQPVLTTELIFLVAILVVGFHRTVGWREALGILAIVAGLAGFFTAAAPAVGTGQPDGRAWAAVSVVTLTCALALVAAGRAGPRWWRAAALGAASAVLFADNAALTKTVTALLRHGGWSHVFSSWEPYLIAVTGAAGLYLLQNALHAGPITASRTASVIVNPLASIVIGVTAFSERLRAGTGFLALDALAIAVMCAGIVILVASPLIGGMSAAGDEYLGSGGDVTRARRQDAGHPMREASAAEPEI